jgi:hypothetical protein
MHQIDASHFNANRASFASHSLSALQVRGAMMLYMLTAHSEHQEDWVGPYWSNIALEMCSLLLLGVQDMSAFALS